MKLYVHYALWAISATVLIGGFFGNILGALGISGVMAIVLLSYFVVKYFFPDQIKYMTPAMQELENDEQAVLDRCRIIDTKICISLTQDEILYYAEVRHCYSKEEWNRLMSNTKT